MRHLRQFFFYSFVVLYLILCPLTILYALGYVLRPGTEHGITKTGLLSLSTTPPGATIYVGHSRYTEPTPAVLHDLLPGSYEISLWLKGYASWSRRVPVESKQATVLEHILLLPNPLVPKQLLPTTFDQFIPLLESPLLIVADGPRLGDYMIYNWKQQERRSLLASDSPWASARLLTSWTMPKSTVVLARVDTRDGVRMLWLDAKEKPVQPVDLTDLVRERPDMVVWHPWERHRLFLLRAGRVSRVEVAQHPVVQNLLDHVRTLRFVGRSLYALTEESAIFQIDADGRVKAVEMDEPALVKALRDLRGDVEIVPADDTLIAFRGENGGLALSDPPYRLTEQTVRGVQWSEDHVRALCWQRDRIGLIEPSDELVPGTTATVRELAQDFAFRAYRTIPRVLPHRSHLEESESSEAPAALTWIYANGHAIEQVFWAYRDAYVLFRDDDQVFLLERPLIASPPPIPLVRVHRRTEVSYNDETGTLHYLDPAGQLSSLQIVPRWELLPRPSFRSVDSPLDEDTDTAVREAP